MAEARKQKKVNSTVLWVAAGIALVLIFFGVRQLTRERLPLRVAEAQRQDLIKTTNTTGKVEPQHIFAAHAPQATLVKAVYVHAGESVPKGKLLLQLDDANARATLAAAAAALTGAQAQLQTVETGGSQQERLALSSNIARAKLNRDQAAHTLAAVEKLEAQGAAAPSEVTQARQQLTAAETALKSLDQQRSQPFAPIDLEHAKSAVVEAQSAYDAAAQVVAQCNVRAPFAGTVYSLPFTRYEYVDAGATLLEMANVSKLQVRAYFDEPDIGDLKLGDPVTIEWSGKPREQWHGRIIALPTRIIPYTTRNVGETLVSIDDASDDLLPNTNVTVTVTTEEVHNALTVPREALYIEDGRDYVYVVAGDRLHRVPIQVGALNPTQFQIVSGIQDHTVVALGTTNGAPISNGALFHVVN
jgi:HlyD family secretion protein